MDATQILAALMTSTAWTDPYPIYAEAHKLGPAAAVEAEDWAVVLVQGHEAADQVLRNPAFRLPDEEYRGAGTPAYDDHPAYSVLSTRRCR